MPQRILSISGLRGIIGDGLDPEYLTRFAAAVGTVAEGGRVVLSRDGRVSGPMVKSAVIAGLLSTGCEVIDLDIATTPTCGVLVKLLNAAAGIQITASHNPAPWNGLKPFSPRGAVLNADEGGRLVAVLNSGSIAYRSVDGLGSYSLQPELGEQHLARVMPLVNLAAIRARRFRVVLDCNHGSGGVLGPRFLEQLGCQVVTLGGTPDGKFEHVPEPIAENLTDLARIVREQQADVGFAQDPDADRLAIVDNTGRYIGEELTLALCSDQRLPKAPGPVVVNGSTSRVIADLAAKWKCEFHRSHVGEANVVSKMLDVQATLGGEGNGGVIEPRVGFVRDSFVSMAYVLEGLAERGVKLDRWVDELPKYEIVKQKIECPRETVEPAVAALIERFHDARAQHGDGLRLDWSDRWVQVRASNTEPILRVIAEAPVAAEAHALCDQALEIVRRVVSRTGA